MFLSYAWFIAYGQKGEDVSGIYCSTTSYMYVYVYWLRHCRRGTHARVRK